MKQLQQSARAGGGGEGDGGEGGGDENNPKVELYIWKKTAGKDVGHTALRIGDNVYNYYPTDENGNGKWDTDELWGSQGHVTTYNLQQFNQQYKYEEITAFSLNLTSKQKRNILKQMDYVIANPGIYRLSGNQCTSVVVNILLASGVEVKVPLNYPRASVPISNADGMSPMRLSNALHTSNAALVNRIVRFTVGQK